MGVASISAVADCGEGEGEGWLEKIGRGARMLNIWSSGFGGPYKSKGSGIDCNIGSMTGSELEDDALGPVWIRFPGALTYALAVK